MTNLTVLLTALLAVPQGAGPAGASAPAPNPCVTCHETLPPPATPGHSFADWRASKHGGAVTCDRCHGGDTTATDKEAAHQGIYPLRDRRSWVASRRIPATCGTCHQQELGYFAESAHYQQLVTTERGPNCVTCHGSMAIHVLSPEELDAACSPCHPAVQGVAPPMLANSRRLLAAARQADSTVRALAPRVELADPRPRAAADRYLRQAQDALRQVHQGWHAFDLKLIDEAVTGAARAAHRADSVLSPRARR
jgi:hypothetical protein